MHAPIPQTCACHASFIVISDESRTCAVSSVNQTMYTANRGSSTDQHQLPGRADEMPQSWIEIHCSNGTKLKDLDFAARDLFRDECHRYGSQEECRAGS